MEIKYGAKVIDKTGQVLGTVDNLMRNSITGEVSKFGINRKAPLRAIFISPDDVFASDENEIKLNRSLEELGY